MRIAFLILAHKNPGQLERLLKALQHPAFDFYIHLDKKINEEPFKYLADLKNVFFIKKRVKVYWATFSVVQSIINGYTEIDLNKYDYVQVISGQDFPLKPADEIYAYILKRKGTEFITCRTMEDGGEWPVAARVKRYYFLSWRIPGNYRLGDFITAVLPERKFPLGYEIVGREMWHTLTTNAIKYCLHFLKKNPAVTRYFKYCWSPDEIVFSTILYNSSFRNNIADNLSYIDWSEGLANPKTFTKADYNLLKNSEKLFARKFDIQKDEIILEELSTLTGTKNEAIV